jgi:hypothetical protein
MGVVARDCEGRVLAAKCQTIQGCMDPLSAEAWAGVQAAKFGEELRIPKLYLEGDAQGVVEAVNAEAMNWSRIGHLVDDMKTLLNMFTQWQVQGVGRATNGVAHILACKTVREGLTRMWLGAIPDCIRDLTLQEHSALVV